MARVESKPFSQYPFFIRWFMARQEKKWGRVLSPTWLWGRSQTLFIGMLLMLGIFQRKKAKVSAGMRSLLSARIAQLIGCKFCVDLNSYNLLKAEGSLRKAEEVAQWRSSDIYSKEERACLAFAEAVSQTPCTVSDELLRELYNYLDRDSVVELCAWISFQNLSARFNSALGAEENGLCKIPANQQP